MTLKQVQGDDGLKRQAACDTPPTNHLSLTQIPIKGIALMTWTTPFAADSFPSGSDAFPHKHLLGIAGLQTWEILYILKEAEQWVALNRSGAAKHV